MLVTNDETAWARAWAFKDHGKSYEAVYDREHPPGFRWLHESFGTNMRMTEMQSAIGRIQLRRLSDWVATRRRHAAALTEAFSMIDALRLTVPPADIFHSYYKYYAFICLDRLRSGWNRDRVMAAINAEGVPCYSGSCSEIYLEKAFRSSGLGPRQRLPVAQKLGETSLMFLVHPTLTDAQILSTINGVSSVLRDACR